MKPERRVSILIKGKTHPIINGKRSAHQRAIGTMRRNRAEGFTILEEQWDVVNALDVNIVLNRVRIIKVKVIVPMIAVGK